MAHRLPALLRARPTRRRHRKGLTITEIMVVLVIMIVLVGVMTPSLMSIFLLDQRKAAKNLALLYEQLHDEAVMRNVTFRVAYDLRNAKYDVEVAETRYTIFTDPDAREKAEEDWERKLNRMGDEDAQAMKAQRNAFSKLEARFDTSFELPGGTVFAGVYTPQYEEMVMREDLDEDEPAIVYSYIFPNGQAERAVVWMASEGVDDEGFTIEIEPLSGKVHLYAELRDWELTQDFIPDAPSLPTQ